MKKLIKPLDSWKPMKWGDDISVLCPRCGQCFPEHANTYKSLYNPDNPLICLCCNLEFHYVCVVRKDSIDPKAKKLEQDSIEYKVLEQNLMISLLRQIEQCTECGGPVRKGTDCPRCGAFVIATS